MQHNIGLIPFLKRYGKVLCALLCLTTYSDCFFSNWFRAKKSVQFTQSAESIKACLELCQMVHQLVNLKPRHAQTKDEMIRMIKEFKDALKLCIDMEYAADKDCTEQQLKNYKKGEALFLEAYKVTKLQYEEFMKQYKLENNPNIATI